MHNITIMDKVISILISTVNDGTQLTALLCPRFRTDAIGPHQIIYLFWMPVISVYHQKMFWYHYTVNKVDMLYFANSKLNNEF